MRAICQRPLGILVLVLVLVAMFAMPAIAHADSDEILTINGATVRVRVIGGKTFIAVQKGGPLVLKYSDGTVMANIPNGTALMVGGLTGGPTIVGGALQLAPIATSAGRFGQVSSDFEVALSQNSKPLTINSPLGDKNVVGVKSFIANPGKTSHTYLNIAFGPFHNKFSRERETDTAGTDRDLLSSTN